MKPVSQHLSAYALFAALLAAAGLPIYIHAPKFFVDEYGVSLASLGAVLFALRLLDVVQDPLFGKLSEKLRDHRGIAVGIACAVMAASMIALFAVPPLLPPLWWFAITLTGVFSAFSFLTISFYAQGVAKAHAQRRRRRAAKTRPRRASPRRRPRASAPRRSRDRRAAGAREPLKSRRRSCAPRRRSKTRSRDSPSIRDVLLFPYMRPEA